MATCVVTGGSRGIGAAIVSAFAQRGDQVFFLYEKNHDAASSVARMTGATAICCDVADAQQVQIRVEIPETTEEPTVWESFVTFLTGLFA